MGLPTPPVGFSVSIANAAKLIDVSDATIINRMIQGKLAFFRDAGITRIIVNWPPGQTPPREGRAPSLAELIVERSDDALRAAKREMPVGNRGRGRPRKTAA